MKKKMLVIVVVSLLSLLLVGQASATQPEVVEITFALVSMESGTPWFEGENMFIPYTRVDVVSDAAGRVELTGTLEGLTIIHPNGKTTWHGNTTWEGTIDGLTGTFTTRTLGLNMAGAPPELIHGQATILSGTGDFVNLRGTMAISGTIFGGPGTFSYHFDP